MGKNTVECIQAGLYHGYLGMVNYVLKKTLSELRGDKRGRDSTRVIATGGLAGFFSPAMPRVDRVVPDLTLQGLRLASEIIS